ncbi:protein of unknown function [Methylacidimicrobium sp. AP8]|nr:protein of unknown function [Methylacidimicrobium sp. AP8]
MEETINTHRLLLKGSEIVKNECSMLVKNNLRCELLCE